MRQSVLRMNGHSIYSTLNSSSPQIVFLQSLECLRGLPNLFIPISIRRSSSWNLGRCPLFRVNDRTRVPTTVVATVVTDRHRYLSRTALEMVETLTVNERVGGVLHKTNRTET